MLLQVFLQRLLQVPSGVQWAEADVKVASVTKRVGIGKSLLFKLVLGHHEHILVLKSIAHVVVSFHFVTELNSGAVSV